MSPACKYHQNNPAECPQAHRCECGALLHNHWTTSAQCPANRAEYFRPDAETLARFPGSYQKGRAS